MSRFLLFFLLGLVLLSPSNALAQFKFDGLEFPPSSPGGPLGPGHLDNRTPLKKGGRSLGFLDGVGGVAFGAIAQLDANLQIVNLEYDPTAADGERLRVTLRQAGGTTKVVVSPISDWLLLPIARFAAEQQDAAMTLFGQAATPEETATQQAAGNDIINYHPVFMDTLAGLRLMHADILVLYEGASELPQYDGNPLLGTGEVPGDSASNAASLRQLHQYMATLPGGPFQSYVVGDFEQTIRVSNTGSKLTYEGNPYWHCWKLKTSNQSDIDQAQQLAADWAKRILQREGEHDELYLNDVEWNATYTLEYQNTRGNEIYDARISRALLLLMPEYSAALSTRIAELGGINPVVYSALRTMMHHAALFRLAKATVPDVLQAFVTSLSNVPNQSMVGLPLLFHPPI